MKITFYCLLLPCILTLNISFSQNQYVEQQSGVTVSLNSVYAISKGQYAYICGSNGTVLKTDNSGAEWVNVSGNGIPSNIELVNICCADYQIAITAGYIGSKTFVYRTTNGGDIWMQVFEQADGFINGVYLSVWQAGFICGNPVGGRWSLWKTSNNGLNWDSAGMYLPQSGSESGWNNAMIVSNDNIAFGTNNSRIYYSSDFGSSWGIQSTGSEINSRMVWINTNNSFTCTGGTNLLATTDGGNYWKDLSAPGNGTIMGYTDDGLGGGEFPPARAWFVRNDNTIYASQMGGAWEAVYTAPDGNYNHIDPHAWGYAYAVRSNGGITRIFLHDYRTYGK
ncbi:MAG: hypothetical protein ABSF32_12685 [Ignavibacteria bacterium]|jgi:photosystem II stability/assembly factor-like uncharacterized protein